MVELVSAISRIFGTSRMLETRLGRQLLLQLLRWRDATFAICMVMRWYRPASTGGDELERGSLIAALSATYPRTTGLLSRCPK